MYTTTTRPGRPPGRPLPVPPPGSGPIRSSRAVALPRFPRLLNRVPSELV